MANIQKYQRHCLRSGCEACRVMKEFHLTLAELDVIALILMGMRNIRIALIRGIREDTVQLQCLNIHRKIGTDDRLGIAMWAIKQGLDWRSDIARGMEATHD